MPLPKPWISRPRPDPYCAFKDDGERRNALNVREYCRLAHRATTVVGVLLLVACNPDLASTAISTLLRALGKAGTLLP